MAGRACNPIPQSAICRVGECDGVWQAGLPTLGWYETATNPVIDHPHANAVSLANLADADRSGGVRWSGDAMLVADPTYHAECEWFAGRACAAIAIEQCDDLIVIVHGCESTDSSNERIVITNRFGAVWRQVQLDRFGCAALPSNMQSQQLWLRALDDGDIPDQQAEHALAVTRCGGWRGPEAREVAGQLQDLPFLFGRYGTQCLSLEVGQLGL